MKATIKRDDDCISKVRGQRMNVRGRTTQFAYDLCVNFLNFSKREWHCLPKAVTKWQGL